MNSIRRAKRHISLRKQRLANKMIGTGAGELHILQLRHELLGREIRAGQQNRDILPDLMVKVIRQTWRLPGKLIGDDFEVRV